MTYALSGAALAKNKAKTFPASKFVTGKKVSTKKNVPIKKHKKAGKPIKTTPTDLAIRQAPPVRGGRVSRSTI